MNKICSNCGQELSDESIFGYCPTCGAMEKESNPYCLKPGTVLREKYLIGRPIGAGGFGITYIGRDLVLDVRIAVKEFYPSQFNARNSEVASDVTVTSAVFTTTGKNTYEKSKKRFLDEARTLARFEHVAGIVNVKDCFEANNTAYIVMEYVDGLTLKEYLEQHGNFAAEDIVEKMRPVMESLARVHEEGLVHRDISPDNIKIPSEGNLKLLDFGAARFVAADLDKTVTSMTKAGYAAEEQYRSGGEQGPWTDVYALCATIYKCVTGVTPPDSPQRLHNKTHNQQDLKTLSELGVTVSPHLASVIKRGMAVLQEDRYQNMNELLDAFDAEPVESFVGGSVAGEISPKNNLKAAGASKHIRGYNGMPYTKGRMLNDGGEGYIYEVLENPKLLVKIYKDKDVSGAPIVTPDLHSKLTYMKNNPPENLVQKGIVAWPIELLENESGGLTGFVMPKLDLDEHLKRAYSYRHPSLEAAEYNLFPSVRSRISIAINLCSALHELHKKGYVIGDFNHANIGVNYSTGQIYFMDCDSFHITDDQGKVHRTSVIMSGYLAPEIINHCNEERAKGKPYNLDQVALPTFTDESDLFCLAIHIFKLLMNGVDPFLGVKYDATGSQAAPFVGNDAIERNSYVFRPGNKPSAVFCPPAESLPPAILDLFNRAFIEGRAEPLVRPNEADWYNALSRYLSNELTQCLKVKKHQHYRPLPECPYCVADEQHWVAQGGDPVKEEKVEEDKHESNEGIYTPGPLRKNWVAVVILIVLAAITFGVPSYRLFSTTYYNHQQNYGNTVGNIVNGGFVAQSGDWIYFSDYNNGGYLSKARIDGSESVQLNNDSSFFINVVDDWVYYCNDDDDDCIYRIQIDGSNRTKLNSDESGYINVVGDWIYYFNNSDSCGIYKISTNGSYRIKITDDQWCDDLNVVDDWIYYSDLNDGGSMYKIRTDGTGRIKINDHPSDRINVIGDWIYYLGPAGGVSEYAGINKMRIDGSDLAVLDDTGVSVNAVDYTGEGGYFGLNVVDNWVYYGWCHYDSDTVTGELYKISKTNGSQKTKISDDIAGYGSICIAGDWIYYVRNDHAGGIVLCKIRTDGTEYQLVNK